MVRKATCFGPPAASSIHSCATKPTEAEGCSYTGSLNAKFYKNPSHQAYQTKILFGANVSLLNLWRLRVIFSNTSLSNMLKFVRNIKLNPPLLLLLLLLKLLLL